jgi:hypothetical protein
MVLRFEREAAAATVAVQCNLQALGGLAFHLAAHQGACLRCWCHVYLYHTANKSNERVSPAVLHRILLHAQVQAASEEAASTCQQQSQQQLRQSVSQSQTLQLQLCWTLHQQLAQELLRLPRMDAAPLESMEAAMPVMVQLPQLTVTALLAVTEQQQAEQVKT